MVVEVAVGLTAVKLTIELMCMPLPTSPPHN
jgi:hypothetical protein